MSFFKKTLLAAALAGPLVAQAVPLTMDLSGLGGNVVTNIGQLDWSAASVLADGGNTAFTNYVNSNGAACQTGGCDFSVYSHGTLAAFKTAGNQIINGTGLGSSFEITYQLGFSEHVISASSLAGVNNAQFGFGNADGSVGTNFFRLFVSSVNSNELAGTGFGDGTKILEGVISPKLAYTSNFQTTGATTGIGGNALVTPTPWAGVNTVVGTGTTSLLDLLSVAPSLVLGSVFTNGLASFLLTNLSTTLPFDTVDPSILFEEDGSADAVAKVGSVNGGTTPVFDPITGAFRGLAPVGDSIIFQTDANSPVTGKVPEPGSLALSGLAIALVSMAGRRRRNQA